MDVKSCIKYLCIFYGILVISLSFGPIILIMERLEIIKALLESLLFLGEDELVISTTLPFPFFIFFVLKA